MIRKISLIAIATCSIFTLTAQNYEKHEFSANLFGGAISLKNKVEVGDYKNKIGGGIGFGYTYFLNENLGIATGIDLSFYNAELSFAELSGSENTFDLDSQEALTYYYSMSNYKETQSAFYLNIPIMLHYEYLDLGNVKFYAAGGFKVGIPVNGKFKSTLDNLQTKGFYPKDNATIDDIPLRGFGEYNSLKANKSLSYKVSYNLAFEVGTKWNLSDALKLYTGVFVDYGLNNVNKKGKEGIQSIVQYNQLSPERPMLNSATYATNTEGENPIVSKINTMGYGIRLRLAFGK